MKLDLRSFLPSVLRTAVPLAVGYLLGFPVVQALGLTEEHITSAVTVLLSGAYWILVRLLETYVTPRLGWLLLWASPPVYVAPEAASGDPVADVTRTVRRTL